MADKKRTMKFNKKTCDQKYEKAEAVKEDCSETCAMPCPYNKDTDPCSMCGVKGCDKGKCKALKIYRNREE